MPRISRSLQSIYHNYRIFPLVLAVSVTIGNDEPITIGVFTSLLNNFGRTFMPPTPIVKTRIECEDLGVADRDVLVLDGSATTPRGNWSDLANTTSRNYSGKLVRAIFNSSGPFRAHVTVTDDTEMVGASDYLVLPENPHFNPPTNLDATYAAPNITATVTDVEGGPVGGCVVNFLVAYGNLSVSPWSATTNVTAGSGTIRVVSGKLPYVEFSI